MEGSVLSSRSRSLHQPAMDILVGAMSVLLFLILGFAFFYFMSLNNYFLRKVNRTLATTLLTFVAMSIAMHAVYGGFEVGRKKNKPVISALISGIAVTDLVTYIQLEIMNVNENYNARLILFGTDLLYLLLCYVIQVIVIILFVRFGNQIYFHFTPPQSVLLILGEPAQEEGMRAKIGQYQLQWRVDNVAMFYTPDLKQMIDQADIVFLGQMPMGAKFTLLKMCYDDRKDVMCKADMEEIMLCNSQTAIVDDAAFLSMKYNKITLFQRVVKRLGDIALSLLALILLSPFILLISLLIKRRPCHLQTVPSHHGRQTLHHLEIQDHDPPQRSGRHAGFRRGQRSAHHEDRRLSPPLSPGRDSPVRQYPRGRYVPRRSPA